MTKKKKKQNRNDIVRKFNKNFKMVHIKKKQNSKKELLSFNRTDYATDLQGSDLATTCFHDVSWEETAIKVPSAERKGGEIT